MMKKMFFGLVLVPFAAPLRASCPMSVKCDLDGEYMSAEETYYNGLHESKKYGHDYVWAEWEGPPLRHREMRLSFRGDAE